VTVTRQGGFAGAVTLAVDGLPAGATAAITQPGTGTTGSVGFTVGAQVPAATYPLTLRATGTGVTAQSLPFELIVSPAAAPELRLSAPVSLTPAQGGSVETSIGILRTGWTGSVALTVSGVPSGMTASLVPASTTGSSATLRLAIGNTPVGTYTLVVRGTGENGLVATANIAVQVVP
jgi:hypothetical protein